MGRKTRGGCIKKNGQIKNVDQTDGSKRPLGTEFDCAPESERCRKVMRLALVEDRGCGKQRGCLSVNGHFWAISREVEVGGETFISLVAQVVTPKALSQFHTAMSVRMVMLSRLGLRPCCERKARVEA